MKLLFCLTRPGFGGAQSIALRLACSHAERGHEVTAIAPLPCEFLDRASKLGLTTACHEAPAELLRYGGETLRLGTAGQAKLVALSLLPYTLRLIPRLSGFDAAYIGEERAMMLFGSAAFAARVPIVWHLQGGLISSSRMVHRLCSKLAHRIACTSHAVKRDLTSAVGPTTPTPEVIYNGIPDRPPPLALPPGPLRLAIAARLVPAKGIHHAIDAIAELPESLRSTVTLDLAGRLEPGEPYLDYLKHKLATLGLESRVRFLGFCEDVHRVFAEADVVLCPSVEREEISFGDHRWQVLSKEGFCLSAAEALRAARPVIASDTYGLSEVVEDGKTGYLVPPGDARAIAQSIGRLAEDRELRAHLGEQGRERFERLFLEGNMVEGFERLFAQAAGFLSGRPRDTSRPQERRH